MSNRPTGLYLYDEKGRGYHSDEIANIFEFINKPKMKDNEFRHHVNNLRELVNTFKDTEQLRGRLSEFLHRFKEECEK